MGFDWLTLRSRHGFEGNGIGTYVHVAVSTRMTFPWLFLLSLVNGKFAIAAIPCPVSISPDFSGCASTLLRQAQRELDIMIQRDIVIDASVSFNVPQGYTINVKPNGGNVIKRDFNVKSLFTVLVTNMYPLSRK